MLLRCISAVAAIGLCAAGCTSVETSAPAGLAAARPIQLDVQAAWAIVHDARVVGRVLHLRSRSDALSAACFSVQNELHHELGRIDGLGRAWRFEPHAEEPRWLTTGTVLEGVRAILELPGEVEMQALPRARSAAVR
jgi:hypothetical protein